MQNGHVESFDGRLRDQCLNANWFRNLMDARAKITPGEMSAMANGPIAVWVIGRRMSSRRT
jgi:hypothetical protein